MGELEKLGYKKRELKSMKYTEWNNVKEDVCISHDGNTDTIYIRKRSKRLPQTITAAEMMALMTDLGYIQGE